MLDPEYRFQRRLVPGRRDSLVDGDALFDELLGAAVVLVKKPAERAGMGPLELFQSRPAFQQVSYQWCRHVVKPGCADGALCSAALLH
jgi:hypothetical protein